ncbi:20653_t:CDS:2 [Funneliformis geosporum]|nr:20653_t:CDS:2 [Funneliformis geosporum]
MSDTPELYVGYNALVSYLRKHKNKSYCNFLKLNRDVIVVSLSSSFNSLDLDNSWVRRFLEEAEKMLSEKEFTDLKKKVKSERQRMTSYWEGIIEECGKAISKKVHNLRKRNNVDYNETRMAKKVIMNVRSQSTQSARSASEEVVIDNNEAEVEQIDDLANFDLTYLVEKVIYEYARELKYESYLHSFIISDIDKEARSLFRNEEWEEIFSSACKIMPKIDKSIIDLMIKYSTTGISLFRDIIFEPFIGASYSKQYFDLNYVNLAYRAMHILWEKEHDFILDQSRLEGWYEHNIWSHLIDPVFHDLEIELVRGEGMSLSSSDRKNDEDQNSEDRKKIGRKGDGIFRMDSLKLSRMLRDMLVKLIMALKGNEQEMRQLQTVGILHSANRFQLLIMDIPKGYICRTKRLDFHEVAGRINDPPLAFVIKDILRAKAIITRTLELVKQGKSPNLDSLYDSDDDNVVERSTRCTTPPTVTNLPKTHKTPTTKRTKDVINEKER